MRRHGGVTLIELLIGLSIAAILASMAAPALADLVNNNRKVTTVNALRAHMRLARQDAVRHSGKTVVCTRDSGAACADQDDWSEGWLVFRDNNEDGDCQDHDGDGHCDADDGRILRITSDPTDNAIRVNANGNPGRYGRVVYTALGRAPGYMSTFSVCGREGQKRARGFTLIQTGRARILEEGDSLLNC